MRMNITLSIFFAMNSIQITEVFFLCQLTIPFKIIKSQSGKGSKVQAGVGEGGLLGESHSS